jgi:hypothetical protein
MTQMKFGGSLMRSFALTVSTALFSAGTALGADHASDAQTQARLLISQPAGVRRSGAHDVNAAAPGADAAGQARVLISGMAGRRGTEAPEAVLWRPMAPSAAAQGRRDRASDAQIMAQQAILGAAQMPRSVPGSHPLVERGVAAGPGYR